MNEVIKEIEHDENCIWSYLGALIGGLVGVIPWIALYYFCSFNLPILTFFIPVFATTGYKYFKGTVNSNTFRTIAIISIIIFLLSIYLFFPYYISQKNDIEFLKFNNSKEYELYYNYIMGNNLGVEIFSICIGLIISYVEISNLLKRYKSTNNMIKDTNTFIREDNDPIDSDEYNGIIFNEKNPVKSKIDVNKVFNEQKGVDFTDYLRNKNMSNNKNEINNYKRINKNKNVANFIVVYFIIIFCVSIIPTITSVFYDKNSSPKLNYSYDFNNNYSDKYYNTNYFNHDYYIFEDQNIEVTIPDRWQIIDKNDNLILQDDEDCINIVSVIESNNNSLKEVHDNIVNSMVTDPLESNNDNIKINGHDTYYYIDIIKDGNYNVFYTMEYEDYFIVLICKDVSNFRFDEWENFLRDVKSV